MSRVIILSNRVKMPDSEVQNPQKNSSAGGLAVAVCAALQSSGGVWLGWNGEVDNDLKANHNVFTSQHFTQGQKNTVEYITTAFSPEQYRHFYCGFANRVLWAFLHDRADLIDESPQDFSLYQQVNELFAKHLQQIAQPDDVIWVHDYHFFGVADYCRKLGMTHRIGFFLHIPFAPSQAWQDCPHAAILLEQLAEYDVIGVQTQADKRHCQQTLQPILEKLKTRQPLIHAYPIGVDVATIARQIAPKIQALQKCQASKQSEKLTIQIVAVDRIDYSKGILRRLQTFARFLHTYPEYQGKLTLVQIAIPSRLDLPAYHELYQAVKCQVTDLQREFSTADWQPILYSETVLAHVDLMALFFDSQICWVNSLKDGMNLVAKEYIAAQNPDNSGVLLLSKYAGASEDMTAAVIIDPYDEQNLMETLKTALTMSHAERQERYQSLIQGLREQDLSAWQTAFLQDLITNE